MEVENNQAHVLMIFVKGMGVGKRKEERNEKRQQQASIILAYV